MMTCAAKSTDVLLISGLLYNIAERHILDI